MSNETVTPVAHTAASPSQSGAIEPSAGELIVYCPALSADGALSNIHWQSLATTDLAANSSAATAGWHAGLCDELMQRIEAGQQALDGRRQPHPITLVLPSHCLLSGSLTLPKTQRRHLHKTLPFLIEEQLSEDVEQMYIAYQHDLQNGELKVYFQTINKQLLNNLLAELNGPHSTLKAIYTETQWLLAQQSKGQDKEQQKDQENEYHQLWFIDNQWLLSQSSRALHSAQSVRLHRDALPEALQMLSSASAEQASNTELTIHCQAPAEQLSESERSTLSTYPNTQLNDRTATCTPEAGVSQRALKRLEQQADNNLLQGHYRPRTKTSNKRALWPALAAGLGILFVLQSGYWLASGWYFQQQQQQLASQTEALYREYFPQDKRIINIRRQAQSHLRQGTQNSSNFLSLLTHFTGVWREQKTSLGLTQLRYQQSRDQLLITLEADSINSLDQLTRKLSHSGLEASLLSAKEIEADGEQQANSVAKFQASISLNRGQHLSQR